MLAKMRSFGGATGAIAALGALIVWACSAVPHVDAEISAGPFGAHVVLGPDGQKTVQVEGPVGTCIKLVYSGADGAEIRSEVLRLPEGSQVPPGTVRVNFDLVPCPEPPEPQAPGLGASPLGAGRAIALTTWHDVYSYPIEFGAGSLSGAICHARVWCGASQDPSAILRPVLLAGPGSAVPPNVQILLFADSIETPLGATMRVSARQPILEMNLNWNGDAGFADLATGVNAVSGVLANGWFTTEFFIAETDVDQTVGTWNRAVLTFATLGQPQAQQTSVGFQVLPN